MSPPLNSWLIAALCVSVGAACDRVACSVDGREEVPSPDGRWKAVVFSRNCTLGREQTAVSILEPSRQLGSEDPNLLIMTYADTVLGEQADAVLESLSLRWTTDSSISIEYDARAMIYYQVTRLWGLVVTYATVAPKTGGGS